MNIIYRMVLIPLFALSSLALSLPPGLYATLKTSMGNITCELFPEQAPLAVKSFVGLATGQQPWLDPVSGNVQHRPLYTQTLFHRVIPNFMIQGGDPTGTGRGGPGYQFADEFTPSLSHNRPGRLSMANSGPNTNGSQFFITQVPTPWLDNHHTIFGQVIDGMSIVNNIVNVKRDRNDKPLKDVILLEVEIKDTRISTNETGKP
jgi:peptidyl-prolyl cis-trans isomerase A (cyclophilin A)